MRGQQPQRPTTNDRDTWTAYWKAQGMPWRTEPEIDDERQQFLAERRAIEPDIERGIYPFCDENGPIKLDRADVEWLLATHESDGICGPVDWADVKQHQRTGLNLCGADLCGANLIELPLARLQGSLTDEQLGSLALRNLTQAATSSDGQVDWDIVFSFDAIVPRLKQMETVKPPKAHLEHANLVGAHLEGAILIEMNLTGLVLGDAYLQDAQLEGADLKKAILSGAHLEGANLSNTNLEEALLIGAHLERADLGGAELDGAELSYAFFDASTELGGVILSSKEHGCVSVSDIRWGDANLTVLDWDKVSELGDEQRARQRTSIDGKPKSVDQQQAEYNRAVRANRQLATVLRAQGMNEDADRFAYRAQVLQRGVLRRQHHYGRWLFSWLLDVLAGHGYKPERSLIAYLLAICGFGIAYYFIGQTVGPHLSPLGAFVFSMTSFHGRGFFPGGIALDDPLTVLAAFEALVGLVIEVSFIATFSQRFFAR